MHLEKNKIVYFYFLGNKLSGTIKKIDGSSVMVETKIGSTLRIIKLNKYSIIE